MIKRHTSIAKWFLQTATLCMALLGFTATAPAAGIDIPSAVLTKGGYSVDFEWGLTSRDIRFSDQEIEERSTRYLMKVGYGLLDGVDLYGTVGAGAGRDDLGFEGDVKPAFGGGIKLRLFKYKNTRFGLTGQAIRFTTRDGNVDNITDLAFGYTWHEYDLALGASTQIGQSVIYAGALLSKLDGVLETAYGNNPSQETHFKESKPIGLFFGGDLLGGDPDVGDRVRLGVEARLITETSVSVKLSFAFGGTRIPK